MKETKKKQFRRIAAVSDDDDGMVPEKSISRPRAGGTRLSSGGAVDLSSDLSGDLTIRMHASGGIDVKKNFDIALRTDSDMGARGGEYSAERLRALKMAQTFRLSVASSGGRTHTREKNNEDGTLEPLETPASVQVAVVEDVDAEPDDSMRHAALNAKARREAARRSGGTGISALHDAAAVSESDDILLLSTKMKSAAPSSLLKIGSSEGRLLHVVAANDDHGAMALPPASLQPPMSVTTPSWNAASNDPSGVLRTLRSALVAVAANAKSVASAAERDTLRVSTEIESAMSAAANARTASMATAAPSYDWYAGLRFYAEELVSCLREKQARIIDLEGAYDSLETAISQTRTKRRAADLADEVAELTSTGASAAAILESCGGTLLSAALGSSDSRRVRRHARRARIAAPLRRLCRALAAGRLVSTADLHCLSDGDESPSESSYATAKRSDVATAARLLLSDVDARYSSAGAVLGQFGPWKTHAIFGSSYVDTLAGVSLADLLAILVRIDLAGSWSLLTLAQPPETVPADRDDGALGMRTVGLGLGMSNTDTSLGIDSATPILGDPLRHGVKVALRKADVTIVDGQNVACNRGGLEAAISSAGDALSLDRNDWFRAVWAYGELPLAAAMSGAASPVSAAALEAEDRLLPRVIQASATSRLASFLRHVYDPNSLVETSIVVAALKECLTYEPDTTAVTSCVAALATRLQVAVNDATLPVITSEEATLAGGTHQGHGTTIGGGGGWHAVNADSQLPNTESLDAAAGASSPRFLHPLTVLHFLQLVKLVQCIAAWEFALAPALLHRLIEDQCITLIAGPLLAYAATRADSACAAAEQLSTQPAGKLHSHSRHAASVQTAVDAVNLHGALVVALAMSLPQALWQGVPAKPPKVLPCRDAVDKWIRVQKLEVAGTASVLPAWLVVLRTL